MHNRFISTDIGIHVCMSRCAGVSICEHQMPTWWSSFAKRILEVKQGFSRIHPPNNASTCCVPTCSPRDPPISMLKRWGREASTKNTTALVWPMLVPYVHQHRNTLRTAARPGTAATNGGHEWRPSTLKYVTNGGRARNGGHEWRP